LATPAAERKRQPRGVGKRVNEWGKGESSGATWAGHAAISSWYPFVVRFCVLISFEFHYKRVTSNLWTLLCLLNFAFCQSFLSADFHSSILLVFISWPGTCKLCFWIWKTSKNGCSPLESMLNIQSKPYL